MKRRPPQHLQRSGAHFHGNKKNKHYSNNGSQQPIESYFKETMMKDPWASLNNNAAPQHPVKQYIAPQQAPNIAHQSPPANEEEIALDI